MIIAANEGILHVYIGAWVIWLHGCYIVGHCYYSL